MRRKEKTEEEKGEIREGKDERPLLSRSGGKRSRLTSLHVQETAIFI